MTVETTETELGLSKVRVHSAGRAKVVHLPLQDRAVTMGVRDEVARHYGLTETDFVPQTTTLDYLIGSVVACLTGTFSARLAALGQETSERHLVADGTGTLVVSGGVIRIRAIDVRYTLALSEDVDVVRVQRAHDSHVRFCPAAASVSGCIELTTTLQFL